MGIGLFNLILLTSCSKEWNNGFVSGKITVYNPESPGVGSPLSGITVYVVDTDFIVDSLDYSHNEAAVINKGITDSKGEYIIAKIPQGNFAVVPVPDSIMYRFELENDTDSVKFTITEEEPSFELDFKAAELSESNEFEIKITVINRGSGGIVSIERPIFLFNIFPTYNVFRIHGEVNTTEKEFTIWPQYGIFGYLYVVSNNFRVSAFDQSGNLMFTRWIANNYFDTPKYAHWQIDWRTQTISRLD